MLRSFKSRTDTFSSGALKEFFPGDNLATLGEISLPVTHHAANEK
jgi:hypothetical protein